MPLSAWLLLRCSAGAAGSPTSRAIEEPRSCASRLSPTTQSLARHRASGLHRVLVRTDKGYCVRKFIVRCRERGIAPHVARTAGRRSPGLDARTTRHAGYAISQRKRKRVEEIFGWPKTYGGLRKTRFVGTARVALHATLAATAYNLLRMAKLAPTPI